MKSSKGYQVVLNDCYGGFGLSKDAVSMLNDKYGLDIDSDYGYVDNDVFIVDDMDLYRMDKGLIDVVKSRRSILSQDCNVMMW